MVPIASLWMPILGSAVLVFLLSFVVHMLLTYHRTDWARLPAESDVADAIRRANVAPGDYMTPWAEGPKAMNDPAFIERMKAGPVAVMTVMPAKAPSMGRELAQWFVFTIIVGVFVAYITGRALPPGADYLEVFRFAGTTAFAAYALGSWPDSIWYKRKWSTTLKNTVDALVYALATAGVFGALWP